MCKVVHVNKLLQGNRCPRSNHLHKVKWWFSKKFGAGAVGGRISPFPSDFCCCPYNTNTIVQQVHLLKHFLHKNYINLWYKQVLYICIEKFIKCRKIATHMTDEYPWEPQSSWPERAWCWDHETGPGRERTRWSDEDQVSAQLISQLTKIN